MNQKQQYFLLFAVVAGMLLSTGCVSYLHSLLPPATYPEIRPQPGATLPALPEYTFEFEDFKVTLTTPARSGSVCWCADGRERGKDL